MGCMPDCARTRRASHSQSSAGRHAVAQAAAHWGWAESATDWREVIARDDIDIVDIVTPGDSHAEIAIAALDAGKHVLCEKPLVGSLTRVDPKMAINIEHEDTEFG